MTGEVEAMAMHAGQSVGVVRTVLPAGEVVRRTVEEATHALDATPSHRD
jgi:hypothetical protein